MNALIVYDSQFGNTKEIAVNIAEVIGERGSSRLCSLRELDPVDFHGIDLMIMGCPTQRHTMSKTVKSAFDAWPRKPLRGAYVAAFDTRYNMPRWKSGSAAPRLSQKLCKYGGRKVAPPESFFVADREGPLEAGEVERAREWARSILAQIGSRQSGAERAAGQPLARPCENSEILSAAGTGPHPIPCLALLGESENPRVAKLEAVRRPVALGQEVRKMDR